MANQYRQIVQVLNSLPNVVRVHEILMPQPEQRY